MRHRRHFPSCVRHSCRHGIRFDRDDADVRIPVRTRASARYAVRMPPDASSVLCSLQGPILVGKIK